MNGRGQLRVYLGAAPGVGKTFKMLEEGHRRRARGTDVVIGFVECHGRPKTEALLAGLEQVPRQEIAYRGATFTETDLDAVLARHPQVALIDELAHTNVPGSGHVKRWQDVETLLDAGITVITTVNIQHLESLNDVVTQITGVPQRETIPDEVVRGADQIELVDMTPEALRRRMAHGNIYAPNKIDAALGNYFRAGNLTALRELALLWVADSVDEELDRYRAEHHIQQTWETRERVVVALTGGPEGDTLIRRAARIADRTKGADLFAVHVARNDGLASGANPAHLARQRILVEQLGGTYHQVVGTSIPTALLDFARGVNATQLVLGASRRGRLAQMLSPGVGVTTTAESGTIDVHLITHEETRQRRARPDRRGLPGRRVLAGHLLGALGLPLLTMVLTKTRDQVALSSNILIYLAAVVAVALVGGEVAALLAAVIAFVLLNFYFTPPLHQFTIAKSEDLFALVVFLAVATVVAVTVDHAARRTAEAARARAEAETLSTVAGSVLRGSRPLPALLEQVRETFALTGVTLLERRPDTPSGPDLHHDPSAWRVAAVVGDQPSLTPDQGDAEVDIGDIALVMRGHPLPAADRRVVVAFAAQAATALRQERLEERAAAVGPLAEIDKLRTALLSAVSHDLRSPIASAKAAVDTLRSSDVHFSDPDRDELLATAAESLDTLTGLVDNLLDMSRLQAGALAMSSQRINLADLIPRAVDDLGPSAREVAIQVPDDLPDVAADPALLERALVNVLANALRYSPPGQPPTITTSEHAGQVETRVIDHGPGIPESEWDRVFLPFQRLGDRDTATGVGLGLALSRGLVEAMGGTLVPDHTPGGGLTMTLCLPADRWVASRGPGEAP